MATSITEEMLVELLRDRGWTIIHRTANLPEEAQRFKGISLHAKFRNGYVLSLQGGDGNYSEPRRKADSYQAIELAAWGEHDDAFVSIDGHDVMGWVNFDGVQNVIKTIENWKEGIRPESCRINRPDAPYRDIS